MHEVTTTYEVWREDTTTHHEAMHRDNLIPSAARHWAEGFNADEKAAAAREGREVKFHYFAVKATTTTKRERA